MVCSYTTYVQNYENCKFAGDQNFSGLIIMAWTNMIFEIQRLFWFACVWSM